MSGAVDFYECLDPHPHCRCGKCRVCGFQQHMAAHGPAYGQPPGSKPYDHEFVHEHEEERPV
jgi:hypothetical protein